MNQCVNFSDSRPGRYASSLSGLAQFGLKSHYAHLLVHGTLHAQGWDHETSLTDARAMESLEAEILAGLGFKNPYQ